MKANHADRQAERREQARTRYARQMRASAAAPAPAASAPPPLAPVAPPPPAPVKPRRTPPRRRRFNDVDAAVSVKLRELRLSRGVTQEQLAGVVGLTFQQIQKYENGSNRIAAGHLYQIARFLGVAIDAFFGDVDEAAAPPAPTRLRAYPRATHLFAALTGADRQLLLRLMTRLIGRDLPAGADAGEIEIEIPAV